MSRHRLSATDLASRLQRGRNYERLYRELKVRYDALREENRVLRATVRTQAARIEELALQVEELRRMIFGRRPTRRPPHATTGGTEAPPPAPPVTRVAASYRRATPPASAVTAVEVHPLPGTCPGCGEAITLERTAVTYVEDLMLPTADWNPLITVTRHETAVGTCHRCRCQVRGFPAPPQAVTLGSNVRAYVAYATVTLRQTYSQIQAYLHDVRGMHVSDGELAAILKGEAVALTPERERIATAIRASPFAHDDETGWPVQAGGEGNHGWVSTVGSEILILLGRSRGRAVAEELRGSPSDQVGVTDGYAAYRTVYTRQQLCWAHPHRRLRDLAASPALTPVGRRAAARARDAFTATYAHVRATLSAPWDATTSWRAERRTRRELTTLSRPQRGDPLALRRFRTTLASTVELYLTCLRIEGIPADNNAAERALRPLVLRRKSSFGSKTTAGATALATVWSVVSTLAARGGNFFTAYTAARA